MSTDPKPRIVNCAKCGSHFQQLADETLCPECVKWVDILARRDSYRKAVRR